MSSPLAGRGPGQEEFLWKWDKESVLRRGHYKPADNLVPFQTRVPFSFPNQSLKQNYSWGLGEYWQNMF